MDNIRKDLIKYGKLLHEKDLVIGRGGNISARSGDTLLIKKKFADMFPGNAKDYIAVPYPSTPAVEMAELSSETPLHLASYAAREDIKAVIHAHSPMSIAASSKTDVLESPSYEFDCIIQKPVPVIGYIQPGSEELASAIGAELKRGANAVLMKRHGAVTVGSSLEEAYLRMLALERACISFLYS